MKPMLAHKKIGLLRPRLATTSCMIFALFYLVNGFCGELLNVTEAQQTWEVHKDSIETEVEFQKNQWVLENIKDAEVNNIKKDIKAFEAQQMLKGKALIKEMKQYSSSHSKRKIVEDKMEKFIEASTVKKQEFIRRMNATVDKRVQK